MNEQKIIKQLDSILAQAQKITTNEKILYFVDTAMYKKILKIESHVNGNAEQFKTKRMKSEPFYRFAKILNYDTPAISYKFFRSHKRIEIFDRAKIQERIPGIFEIWKNTKKKNLDEAILRNEIPVDLIDVSRKELEEKITEEQNILTDLVDNFSKYDIAISSFEDYKWYDYIYFVQVKDDKHVRKTEHLRDNVPNILWYEDIEKNTSRINDKISKIIQDHDKICDAIYFKKIERK
ncbi:hypothetical protein [Aquamicrobium sp.]|uniref:hypothetical protein n=1 Tax=Aquamicrobium sp. TaxID=1872579 RepID=UPI00258E528C|nr:hypothetical protein [Aquamicrobium sp.]MCK9549291.1 hypothetical protein [Aquamicrobium sp.]